MDARLQSQLRAHESKQLVLSRDFGVGDPVNEALLCETGPNRLTCRWRGLLTYAEHDEVVKWGDGRPHLQSADGIGFGQKAISVSENERWRLYRAIGLPLEPALILRALVPYRRYRLSVDVWGEHVHIYGHLSTLRTIFSPREIHHLLAWTSSSQLGCGLSLVLHNGTAVQLVSAAAYHWFEPLFDVTYPDDLSFYSGFFGWFEMAAIRLGQLLNRPAVMRDPYGEEKIVLPD